MPYLKNFPACYDPSSERRIVTPSPFGRENLFFLQEAGHIKLLQSHAGTQRSSLDSFLVVSVVKGRGRLEYEGKSYPLREGQCFWVDCRRPHSYRSAPQNPWELRWVHYNGRSAPAFYHLFESIGGPTFTPISAEGVNRRLENVLAEARRWDASAELRASAEIAALLAELLGSHPQGRGPELSAGRVEELRSWVAEHCAEPFTLDELSARFFISKFYMARSFKQRYGETIFDFALSARIDLAKQMLRYTELNVGEIAAKCGFKEQTYFTRRFREVEGQTASQYRRAWRGRHH